MAIIIFNSFRPSDAYICVSKLTIIGSDNGLAPSRRQAIILTNTGILLIRTLGTNFNEIWGKIDTFSFKKMHLKMLSAKWRQFSLGLNVLTLYSQVFYWLIWLAETQWHIMRDIIILPRAVYNAWVEINYFGHDIQCHVDLYPFLGRGDYANS